MVLVVKNLLAKAGDIRETWVWSLAWEDPLEEDIATPSSTLAWRIQWTEEPGRLQSIVPHRVGHDLAHSTHMTELSPPWKIKPSLQLKQDLEAPLCKVQMSEPFWHLCSGLIDAFDEEYLNSHKKHAGKISVPRKPRLRNVTFTEVKGAGLESKVADSKLWDPSSTCQRG